MRPTGQTANKYTAILASLLHTKAAWRPNLIGGDAMLLVVSTASLTETMELSVDETMVGEMVRIIGSIRIFSAEELEGLNLGLDEEMISMLADQPILFAMQVLPDTGSDDGLTDGGSGDGGSTDDVEETPESTTPTTSQ